MSHNKAPLYLPFLKRADVIHMGLSSLQPEQWIEPDELFDDYFQNKTALFNTQPDSVYGELPESLSAQQEFSTRLLSHLTQHHSNRYSVHTSGKEQQKSNDALIFENKTWPIATNEKCLWHSSLWIQDDICLLQEKKGEFILTAASLCAPSEWRLADKLGEPMFNIHAPVPGLNNKIGTQINHVLAKLSPLRPFQRFNWSIKESHQLALIPNQDSLETTSEDSSDCSGLYVRVERQTLTRLPKTQAIAFTIRVYIYTLEEVARVDGAINALKKAVESMSAEEVNYKSFASMYPKFRQACKALNKQ